MPTPLRSQLILPAASLLAGVVAGKLLVNPTTPPPEELTTASPKVSSVDTSSTSDPVAGATLNTTSPSSFASLPRPQQLDTLVRISRQTSENPSLQLLLAQLATDLPAPVIEELLTALAGRTDGPFLATTLLAERLAATDPARAIELGTNR